jgi:hypothetical protein
VVAFSFLVLGGSCSKQNSIPPEYTGSVFHDSVYNGGPQQVPGRIQCEYYDFGGEGMAFHDSDPANNGSGRLNPADGTYLNEFRKDEAVDISYTKFRDQIDDNPYNLVPPIKDQLYLGWTVPGEWVRYTVDVRDTGKYTLNVMYTSNGANGFSLSLDNQELTGPLTLVTTHIPDDPIPWRQWHHWNKMTAVTGVLLKKGLHILTLYIREGGNMNFDYLEFEPGILSS